MQRRIALRQLSPHRIARLVSWARLWLCWLAGALFQLIKEDPRLADRFTRFGAQCVTDLILQSAFQAYRPVKYPRRYGVRRSFCGARLVRGSRLRKAISKRDLLARLVATLELMRDFDSEIARFRRRVASGLRRWHGSAYAWRNEALNAPPARVIARADSS
jgi:hypothetical protein